MKAGASSASKQPLPPPRSLGQNPDDQPQPRFPGRAGLACYWRKTARSGAGVRSDRSKGSV